MTMRALPPLRPYPWPDWPAVLEECPPKYATLPTEGAEHRLPEIERLARALGFPELQPWQKLVIRVATEHIDGVPVYRKIVFSLPRRPGKTALVVVVITDAGLRTSGATSVVYAAQGGKETRDRLEKDFHPIWVRSKFAEVFDMTLRKSPMGDVFLAAFGSWINTWGGSEVAAHGSGNLLVVGDELFAHKTTAVEGALIPSIKEEPKAQQWWTSARGTLASVVLENRIKEGRAAVETDTCKLKATAYFEWGAPDDIEEGSDEEADPEVHRLANPAIGYTLEPWKVMDAFHDLSRSDFRRMELNLVAAEAVDAAIPATLWQAVQADKRTTVDPTGGVVLGLAAEGDRRHLATAVACDSSGNVRLVERWALGGDASPLIDWVRRHRDKPDLRGVAISAPGPLAVYAGELEDAGVNVIRYNAADAKVACGYLYDSVASEAIQVFRDRELDDAVAQAIRWPREAKHGWTFGWADPAANISSVWAMALAVHAATYTSEPEKPELEIW